MKGWTSARSPQAVPPLVGYGTAEVTGRSASFHPLSFDRRVWELATSHVGLAVLAFAIILVTRYVRSPWRRVPPGPRGLPIIGNASKLQDKTWLFGRDCKQKYSAFSDFAVMLLVLTTIEDDMVYLNALGQPVIVFNSIKPAAELLDRRANIYSDRPRLVVANEILSGGLFSAFLPYGDT